MNDSAMKPKRASERCSIFGRETAEQRRSGSTGARLSAVGSFIALRLELCQGAWNRSHRWHIRSDPAGGPAFRSLSVSCPYFSFMSSPLNCGCTCLLPPQHRSASVHTRPRCSHTHATHLRGCAAIQTSHRSLTATLALSTARLDAYRSSVISERKR